MGRDRHIKRIGAIRAFLNKPFEVSMTSCISYKVEVNSWKEELRKEDLYNQDEISFSMADCSRVISLEFDISDKEGMVNSLFKLDTIINTCQAMKEDLKTARKLIIVGQKRYEEIEEQERLEREKRNKS